MVSTFSHTRALNRSPLPVAKLQLLIVDIQHTNASFQANAHRGPIKHHGNLFFWDTTHIEVRVQVEAIGATGTFTYNRSLAIHRKCALTPMP